MKVSKKFSMEIFERCSSMSNVTIVCSDGIIQTHKIIVASASDFIKQLLSEVPVGDEITLYLPDHRKCRVLELLDGIFSVTNQPSSNDLIEFGCTSIVEPVIMKVMSKKLIWFNLFLGLDFSR